MTTARLIPAALAATVALAGCTDWAGYDIDKASEAIPQLANMRRSVIPDPYAMPRSPAPGTVPVLNPMGDIPAEYSSAQLDSAAATLTNPYPQPSEAVLARGKLQYDNNCTVCHGPTGAGDGPVVKPVVVNGQTFTRFPYAPPLVSGGALTRSDGYLYAITDVGRGLMPPYGHRLTHNDRWAVVAYVRQLQRAAGATPTPQPAVPQAPNATAPAPGAGQPAGAGGTTVTTPGGIQPGDSVPTAAAPAGPGTR